MARALTHEVKAQPTKVQDPGAEALRAEGRPSQAVQSSHVSQHAEQILRLQRAYGNRAVLRMLEARKSTLLPRPTQTKLEIGTAAPVGRQQRMSPKRVLQRQPESTVRVDSTEMKLQQGAGGSGAIIYEYTARARNKPSDLSDKSKPGTLFDIKLPLLVYPPADIDTSETPPKVDIFVFFHGMRATYQEGTKTQAGQGWEPIAVWTQLKEAIGASGRLGIAPQAPATWVFSNDDKVWKSSTAQWYEALGKVGFDGLINIALDGLSKDLGLTTPLAAGAIHVAGHSAGGQGIIRATSHDAGATTFSDQIQDLTLQDAGYGFDHWDHMMDWLLDGSPGKTVRVLVSDAEQKRTRRVVKDWLNVSRINLSIKKKKKTEELEAVDVPVLKPEDQKPRPGGFVLESELIIKSKTGGDDQATIVVFFSPGGKHYSTASASMAAAAAAGPQNTTDFLDEATPGKYRVIGDQDEKTPVFNDQDFGKKPTLQLPLNTVVEVTSLEMRKPKDPKDKNVQPYIAKIKTDDGTEGWMRLANLTRE